MKTRNKKASKIDTIIRKNQKNGCFLSDSFNLLTREELRTLGRITRTHSILKRQDSNIEQKSFGDQNCLVIPQQLLNVPNDKLEWYILGIIESYSTEILEFVRLETMFKGLLYNNKIEDAILVLSEIEDVMGLSNWLISSKITCLKLLEEQDKSLFQNKGYNEITEFIFNLHSKNIDDFLTDKMAHSSIEDVFGENLSNLKDIFLYRIYGIQTTNNLNIYEVIKYELNNNITDLYKCFEDLYILTINNDIESTICDPMNHFMRQVDHPIQIINNNINKKILDLDITKCLTDINYLYQVTRNIELPDVSTIKFLAKTISIYGVRLLSPSLNCRLINLFADIIEKNSNFKIATISIANLCVILKGHIESKYLGYLLVTESSSYHKDRNESCRVAIQRISPSIINEYNSDLLIKNICLKNHIDKKIQNEIIAELLNPIIVSLINNGCYREAEEKTKFVTESKNSEYKKNKILCLALNGKVHEAADIFIQLHKSNSESINYYITREFYQSIFEEAKYGSNVSIPVSLYLSRECGVDQSLNRNATAISIGRFILKNSIKTPSEYEFSKECYTDNIFLGEVCNKELLCKSLLFRSQKDAFDERIKICNKLANEKVNGSRRYINEAMDLSKRKVLEAAENQVNNFKVYADKDYIRSTVWDDIIKYHANYYLEDKEFERINDKNSSTVQSETDTSDALIKFITRVVYLGNDNRRKILHSLMKRVIEEYCFGLKGLNGYLSTRIRHGTLSGTLLNPLINSGIFFLENKSTQNQFRNSLLDLPNNAQVDVVASLLTFNKSLNSLIETICDKWIQINTNNTNNSEYCFDFSLNEKDLLQLQLQMVDQDNINYFWDQIESWLDDNLKEGCKIVINNLNEITKPEIIKLFNELEKKIDSIFNKYKLAQATDLNKILMSSKRHIFKQIGIICGWFDTKSLNYKKDYDIDIVVEIAKNMLQFKNIEVKSSHKIDIRHDLLSSWVDMIYNLTNNAIKYTTVESDKLNIIININISHTVIKLSVSNNTNIIDPEKQNFEISKYNEYIDDNVLIELLQKEGRSGLAKIRSIIRHEFNSNEDISLRYEGNDLFVADISFPSSGSVIVHERFNSGR